MAVTRQPCWRWNTRAEIPSARAGQGTGCKSHPAPECSSGRAATSSPRLCERCPALPSPALQQHEPVTAPVLPTAAGRARSPGGCRTARSAAASRSGHSGKAPATRPPAAPGGEQNHLRRELTGHGSCFCCAKPSAPHAQHFCQNVRLTLVPLSPFQHNIIQHHRRKRDFQHEARNFLVIQRFN